MITTQEYTTLDKAYQYFNEKLWDGKLPDCIVTLHRKKGENGYYWHEKFYTKNIRDNNSLMELSNDIYNSVGYNFQVTPIEIYNYLTSLIFEKSWDGFINKTNSAIEYLRKNNFSNIVRSSEFADTHYAIDLFAKKKSIQYAVQIKPETFTNKHYKYHYLQNLKKNLKFLENECPKAIILYLFYNKDLFFQKIFDTNSLKREIYANS